MSWLVVKINNLNFFKEEAEKKIGGKIEFYIPKLKNEKRIGNKISQKETNLLGNYAFFKCEKFNNKTVNILRFCKGLKKLFAESFIMQNEIINFINRCKSSEDEKGFITGDFFRILNTKRFKFLNGPFSDKIFTLISEGKTFDTFEDKNFKFKVKKSKYYLCSE